MNFDPEVGDFWCNFDEFDPDPVKCPGTAAMLRGDCRFSFFSWTLARDMLYSYIHIFIFQPGVKAISCWCEEIGVCGQPKNSQ